MAISYVGSDSAAATSLTLPTHQSGDLIIIAAFGTGSAITIPSGVVPLKQSGATNRRLSVGYITADSASEVSGTWTNATVIAAVVYRSDSGNYLKVASQSSTNTSSTSIQYTAIATAFSANANAWAVGIAGMAIDGACETAPALMTNREHLFSTNEIAIHDTDGNVTTWASTTVTTTTGSWATWGCEINETDIAIPVGGGGVPLIGTGGLVY